MMVTWRPGDEGKIVNRCRCGGTVRITDVRKGEIRKQCDECSMTVEKPAETEVRPG